MRLKLLGQAGLELTLDNGVRIVSDPYLSDELFLKKGEIFRRQIPSAQLDCPDVLLITHGHADHMDLPTLIPWLNSCENLPVFGPYEVYQQIAARWPSRHRAHVMRPEVEVTIEDVRICAVEASHETPEAVGYLIKAEGKTVYVTGDTLYTRKIPRQLRDARIDVMLVCINGFGNNMNARDAARLTAELKPELAIPVHWDMFARFGADPDIFVNALPGEQKVCVLKAFETISI